MAGRLRNLAGQWGPAALAGAAGAASVVLGVASVLPPDRQGVLNYLAITCALWAFWHHHRGARLRPGEIAVTMDDYRAGERLVIESIAAAHGEGCAFHSPPSGRVLRSV